MPIHRPYRRTCRQFVDGKYKGSMCYVTHPKFAQAPSHYIRAFLLLLKDLQELFDYEERWNDRWCVDISEVLVQVIEASWAREELIPPYHIYLKMAYHLSQEARAGLSTFRIPRDFPHLFEYQSAAVKIAAHHLNKRGGGFATFPTVLRT